MESRQNGPGPEKVIIPASLYERLRKEGHDMRLYQPSEMIPAWEPDDRMSWWRWLLVVLIVAFVVLTARELYEIINHPGR